MKLDAGMPLFQRRPFGMRLLHAVLAEHALTYRDRLLDDGSGDGLGHRDKLDALRLAPRGFGGEGDLLDAPGAAAQGPQ